LFKNIPDVFVFATIRGAHPKGHRRFAPMLTIAPDNCLFAAIRGAHPKGQRFALFKNIPCVFVFTAIHGAYPKGHCSFEFNLKTSDLHTEHVIHQSNKATYFQINGHKSKFL
jgi:hypothetical protein